jgi:hypothetical protein
VLRKPPLSLFSVSATAANDEVSRSLNGSTLRSENRSEGLRAVNSLGITYKYFTAYVKRRKHVRRTHISTSHFSPNLSCQGLGLRLVNQNQRAVVAGFTPEYLRHASVPSFSGQQVESSTAILPGDVIMAVENLDTSDPSRCNFDRVIQHLSKAGSVRTMPVGVSHPHHVSTTTCVWDEDPLNFSHRTSSIAKYNDTICIKFARPSRPLGVSVSGGVEGEVGREWVGAGGSLAQSSGQSKGRRYAFGTTALSSAVGPGVSDGSARRNKRARGGEKGKEREQEQDGDGDEGGEEEYGEAMEGEDEEGLDPFSIQFNYEI